jgi:hypothetical protein
MLLQPHPLLWTAIENTRMIQFAYHGRNRIVEPHDHGILNGAVQLLSWQVAGSNSHPLPNWLLTKVDEMTGSSYWIRTSRADAPPPLANISNGTCCSSGSSQPAATCVPVPSNPVFLSSLDREIASPMAQPGFGMTYSRRNSPRGPAYLANGTAHAGLPKAHETWTDSRCALPQRPMRVPRWCRARPP